MDIEKYAKEYFKDLAERAEAMGLIKDGKLVPTPFQKKMMKISEDMDKQLNSNPVRFPTPKYPTQEGNK